MQTWRWHARATALAAGLLLADPGVAGVMAAYSVATHRAAQVAALSPDGAVRGGRPAAPADAGSRAPATVDAFRVSYRYGADALGTRPVTRSAARARARQLPGTGFEGMAVAAIGTALAGAGWLLMLAGSRRWRRRSR